MNLASRWTVFFFFYHFKLLDLRSGLEKLLRQFLWAQDASPRPWPQGFEKLRVLMACLFCFSMKDFCACLRTFTPPGNIRACSFLASRLPMFFFVTPWLFAKGFSLLIHQGQETSHGTQENHQDTWRRSILENQQATIAMNNDKNHLNTSQSAYISCYCDRKISQVRLWLVNVVDSGQVTVLYQFRTRNDWTWANTSTKYHQVITCYNHLKWRD